MERILITGGSGFLGQHLAKFLKSDYEVILASRNQKALKNVASKLELESAPLNVVSYSDVYELVKRVKPNIIIHGAATKFVDLAEKYPNECIDINVLGSQNIARVAIENNVDYVIGISTDKASPPIANLYGMTKALMEKLFVSLNGKTDTQFSCVRYGNVAWSTGSVFPIWEKMISENGHIVTTGPDMSRFFFPVSHAVRLVNAALRSPNQVSGKILSIPMKGTEMRRILDIWTKEANAKWSEGQRRPGDRDLEYLISETEIQKTRKIKLFNEDYFLLDLNAHKTEFSLQNVYSSKSSLQLSDEEITNMILNSPEKEI